MTISPERVLGWLLGALVGTVVTVWLVRRLWKGRTEATSTRKRIAALVAGAAMVGAFATLLGLVKTFGAVGGESGDPSQRAVILAEGSSEGMSYVVFGMVVWVPSLIAAWIIARPTRARG